MQAERGWRLIRFFITAAFLFIIWLLFTASFKPFSLIAGLGGSLLIAAMTYDVFIAKHQANIGYILPQPFFLLIYFFIIIFFLYQSSIAMLIAVIKGKANPRIVHFRTRLRSDLARMLLANSITLTPGTITLDLNDDHLTVHWFFSNTSHTKAAGKTIKGRLEKHIKRVWR
ncbi:MAG: Na+/H+ antiporter subunit E [Spirochaetales bacterium]|jgi:multicomponent Na+:H+ antiporter subunit E|nr:Na+/H+ antiporter subunit E [Spirochaetales bacterium]